VNSFHHIFGRFAVGTLRVRTATAPQDGQALIEYALIISLIALIAIASLKVAGTNISSILHTIAGEV
jgi:Flp pilus assembly pilin Flp